MNNWEVYKLLAHVRPPVTKAPVSSLPLTLSFSQPHVLSAPWVSQTQDPHPV